jgi:hypothetical protein
VDVVAVNGNTDCLWYPAGGGGVMWMPETFGASMSRKLNIQHALVAVNVIAAVPVTVAVVWRQGPVRVALSTTVDEAGSAAAEPDVRCRRGEKERGGAEAVCV